MTTSHMPEDSSSTASPKPPIVGVLLVHGLNGNQNDMAELAKYLEVRAMVTHNVSLPGHGLGVHVRELLPLGWEHWEQAVRDELADLRQRCDMVFLVGHSLGGALILHIAAHEEVAGVVSMCAPVYLYPWTLPFIRILKRVVPMLPSLREDVRDHTARRRYKRDYRWTPLSPVESLMNFLPHLRAELPHITVPALIMASIYDHVVPARDGREIYRHIGSREKHLVVFHRSYHVIMKDHDRDEVFAKTAAFIARHAAKARILSTQASMAPLSSAPPRVDQSA